RRGCAHLARAVAEGPRARAGLALRARGGRRPLDILRASRRLQPRGGRLRQGASPVTDPLAEFRLDGDVAVVTGGASGIGRVVADAFAAVGAHVVVFDLAADGKDAYQVDVADEAHVAAAFADVAARLGRVDVLFNNAGIALRRPTVELSLADWNKVVAVNMSGVFLCAREAARHMFAGGRGGRRGHTAP